MVARLLVPLSDGNVGGSVLSCRDCLDQRRCTLSILQLVGLQRHLFPGDIDLLMFIVSFHSSVRSRLQHLSRRLLAYGPLLVVSQNRSEWECSLANGLRSISLGRCPRSWEKPSRCVLVYWLDFNRWSDCSHRIRSLCWWIAVPSSHHLESSRYICSRTVPRHAFLLAHYCVQYCGQHLGRENTSTYQPRIWGVAPCWLRGYHLCCWGTIRKALSTLCIR